MKQKIDRETADRKMVDAMPWYQSFPVGLAAGILDPSVLLPGGAFLMSLLEAVTGRPLPERVQHRALTGSLWLMIAFAIWVVLLLGREAAGMIG